MSSVDDVIEGMRAAAGADFAFLLTQRGRLVTHDAPRDMPETGRNRLVAASREIGDADSVAEVEMPREQLVPFGGAAPVDVFVAVAGGQAVVCLVMASWADKKLVIPALQDGLLELEPILATAARRRRAASGKRRIPTGAPPPGGKAGQRGAMSGLLHLAGGETHPAASLKHPPPIDHAKEARPARPASGFQPTFSAPDIRIGEAPLGRASLEAIEHDEAMGRLPALGFTPGAGSMPDVRVELVSMGRDTEVELRHEETKRMHSLVAIPDRLIAPVASRLTQPWVEDAISTKRITDAALKSRKVSPPKVTVKLEDADEETLEALLIDQIQDENTDAEGPPSSELPRAPQTSLDVWRDGLSEITGEPGKKPPAKK